jgi:Mg2+-importing ATPase
MLVLLLAAAVAALLGDELDFLLITLIVVASGTIDFGQEYKSSRAAQKLKEKVHVTATVWRDGQKEELPVSRLVPGDIFFLSAGDIVPADGRILTAKDFFLDQSTLSGESLPVEKEALAALPAPTTLSARKNCVFLGTHVVSGEATVVGVRTGLSSEYGQLAKHLTAKRPPTAFEKGLTNFSYLMMKITLSLTFFVFVSNLWLQRPPLTAFLFALALAVGMVPELLPMIVTINLAQGAVFMAKKGVIVKYLPAVQNFGAMDLLCTDKTGTLTEGKIKLERYENIQGTEDPRVLLYAYLNSFFQTGLKNPLDEAIMAHRELAVKDYTKIDEIPYDFLRKRLSVVLAHDARRLLLTKGAPESIFPLCAQANLGGVTHPLGESLRRHLQLRFAQLSQEGYRVLALSYKYLTEEKEVYEASDEKEMSFLGFTAFYDPPKAGVKASLQKLEKAGITVKVLTGDNELVAQKICRDLNLPVQGVVLGSELENFKEKDWFRLAEQYSLFARLSPEQKTSLITAFKKAGYVVGFLGDGINDAPSLREADIGISVNNAVDVAKESADLILLKKSLSVLVEGVTEGRKTFGNIMKYLMMATSSNFGNMFSVAAASVFLPFLPMLPVQILLNNFLYDLSQLTLYTDNVDAAVLRQPQRWNLLFLQKFMLLFGPISSFFDFLTFALLLFVFKANEATFQAGWFLESLASQVLIIFGMRTALVPFFKSRPSFWLLLNAFGIVAVAFWLLQPPLGRLFAFGMLPWYFYAFLLGLLLLYFLGVEVAKKVFYRRFI